MTTETIAEEFVQTIPMIIDATGHAAEYVLETFAGAQPLIGALMISRILIIVIGTAAAGLLAYRWCHHTEDGVDVDDVGFSTMVALIVSIVLIAVTYFIGQGILHMYCPEYTAMSEIIYKVTGNGMA